MWTDPKLRSEINKRLTLNWLIQGASQHAGLTLHHLMRDQLTAIDPRLIRVYDHYALMHALQFWQLDALVILGRPARFWGRAASSPDHPFFDHPVLSRHGGMLAEAWRQRALARCKEKGVRRIPIMNLLQLIRTVSSIMMIEKRHRLALIELAKDAAAAAWRISRERLDGDFTFEVAQTDAFGPISPPRTLRGHILHASIAGYSGVVKRDNALVVVARARNFPLL